MHLLSTNYARHCEEYKERKDMIPILKGLYGSYKTNPTPGPNSGDWGMNVLWVSIVACTDEEP